MDTTAQVQRVEDEVVLFIRATRQRSMRAAAEIDPQLDLAGLQLLMEIYHATREENATVRGTELAESFGVHKSTISRALSSLERLGLLERQVDPRDRRARLVRPTADAEARVQESLRARHEAMGAALADWSPEELDSLARLISRLNHDLD